MMGQDMQGLSGSWPKKLKNYGLFPDERRYGTSALLYPSRSSFGPKFSLAMHPSSLGRSASGGQSSLNQTSNIAQGSADHPRSSSGNRAHRRAQGAQPSSLTNNTAGNNRWYHSSPSGSGSNPKSNNESSSASSSSMIGPTSTFYNPDDRQQQQSDEQAQYQQWLDSYSTGQQQSQHLGYSSTFRREVEPQQAHQSAYNFIQGAFPSSAAGSQYDGSNAGTVTQAAIGSLSSSTNDVSSYQTQTNDLYSSFYPDPMSISNSVVTTPEHNSYSTPEPATQPQSYSVSPDPVYQQQMHHGKSYDQQQHQANSSRRIVSNPSLPAQSGQFLPPQVPGARYVQRNPSEQGNRTSSYANAPSSQSSSLSPPPNVWSNETNFPGKNTSASDQPSHQFGVLDSQPAAGKAATSQSRPNASHLKRPNVNATVNARPNAGQPSGSAAIAATASSTSQASLKRKRAKKNEIAETQPSHGGYADHDSDSDSYDDDDDGTGLGMTGGIGVGLGGLGVVGRGGRRDNRGRLPGACTHCKKLKMKCDFPKHENTCKRCKSGGHVCIVEGRRPRTAPNKREYLLAQIRQKDAIIDSLLKQLHNPYIATPLSIASYRMATSPSDHNNNNVLAWLDRLQSSVRDAGKKSPRAFFDLRGADGNDEESEVESENRRIQDQLGQSGAMKVEGNDDGEPDDPLQNAEKPQASLPESHVPLGLIAALSLSSTKTNKKKDTSKEPKLDDDLNDDNVGVANETYFMPGPATDLGMRASLIEQHSAPEILVHGLVKPEDVEKLFQIFYERVNPFISLLDPVLHTPASTFARCPFLFTVICAISSRYYAEKSEIYPIAMHFAKHSAANALIDGWKSVELCQAYILMSIYAVPARRWEEDRSWLYTGLAIRIATDLNLHQVSTIKPTSENQEREILNKTRVWMMCFNLDRSTATQFGKPSTIKEDFIVRNAKDWYKKSQYNLSYDVHLCGYSALLQIVAKFHDEIFSDPSSPTGLNKKVNFRAVTLAHDAHLTRYHEEWDRRFKEDSDASDPGSALRCSLLPFLVGYSRLVMFSFGFQQAYQRGFENEDSLFFTTCLEAAKSVIENMINGLAPSGYMRYAPDGHFVFASFASAFLLKLLRPEFSSFLEKEQENEIFDLIGRLIQTLSSPKIAIDDRHTPKLYARFLAGLLSRHRRDGATVGRLQTVPAPQQSISGGMQGNGGSSVNTLSSHPVSHPNSTGQTGPGENGLGQSFDHQVLQQISVETPVYMTEATFASSTGQIDFGADFDMTYLSSDFSEQEMLATMQAIKNPAWWQNMMMPGFSWPEASPSPPANSMNNNIPNDLGNISSSYLSNLGPSATFGMYHSAQVMM